MGGFRDLCFQRLIDTKNGDFIMEIFLGGFISIVHHCVVLILCACTFSNFFDYIFHSATKNSRRFISNVKSIRCQSVEELFVSKLRKYQSFSATIKSSSHCVIALVVERPRAPELLKTSTHLSPQTNHRFSRETEENSSQMLHLSLLPLQSFTCI